MSKFLADTQLNIQWKRFAVLAAILIGVIPFELQTGIADYKTSAEQTGTVLITYSGVKGSTHTGVLLVSRNNGFESSSYREKAIELLSLGFVKDLVDQISDFKIRSWLLKNLVSSYQELQ